MAAGGFFEGFFPGRRARINAEAAAAERSRVVGGLDMGVDELVSSTADPAEAAAWQDRWNSMKDAARSSDPEIQKEGLQGLLAMGAAVQGALERQRADRSELVIDALRDQRKRFIGVTANMREVNANARQFAALVNDPGFDPKNPINAGQLLKLVNSGPRQVFDPEDMADALGGVGAQGLLGGVIQLVAGTMAAEDFNVSKDDWRRLGAAMYKYSAQPYLQELARIQTSATELNGVAAKLGMFSPGYDALRYVTEQAQEFEAENADLAPRGDAPAEGAARPEIQESARGFLDYLTQPQAGSSVERLGPAGPTPLASDPGTGQGWFDDFAEGYLEPYRAAGDTIMIDPNTGDAYAQSHNTGQQRKIELPAMARFALRRRVKK